MKASRSDDGRPDVLPWRGRWALVTGASSGIGAAIATELARGGAHVLLTARREERLVDLARDLEASHRVRTEVVAIDLALPDAPDRVFAFARSRGIDIDVLINNAGIGAYGPFATGTLASQLAMVQLHCAAVVHLTHLFLPAMIERRRGHVMMVATTLLAPAPYLTTYAATKGFELLFAEGLGEEVARHGVRVTALCPGPTATEMVGTSDGAAASGHRGLLQPRLVARRGLAGLARGVRIVRPSWSSRLTAVAPRLLPRATISGVLERHYRPPDSKR